MAIAIPVPDGYLSVRLKPTSPLFALAQEIYADVLAVEQAAEGGDVRERKASIEAGADAPDGPAGRGGARVLRILHARGVHRRGGRA